MDYNGSDVTGRKKEDAVELALEVLALLRQSPLDKSVKQAAIQIAGVALSAYPDFVVSEL